MNHTSDFADVQLGKVLGKRAAAGGLTPLSPRWRLSTLENCRR